MLPIVLTRYNRTFLLPRETVMTAIPESLLGQALQEEPNVPDITLDNPDVTPAGLQVVTDYLQGKEPQMAVPGLSSTARYLNMPWLVYYEDPLYDYVVKPGLHGHWDNPINQSVLNMAAKQNDLLMVNYLLQKGVTPSLENDPMLAAITNGNLAMVQLLRQKILPNDFEDIYLEQAIIEHKDEVALWMLQDPIYEATLPLYLQWAASSGNIPVLTYLLPRTDPSVEDNSILKEAVENNQAEALKILLQDPRVKPQTIQDNDRRLSNYLARHCRSEVYSILVQDKRFRFPLPIPLALPRRAPLPGQLQPIVP